MWLLLSSIALCVVGWLAWLCGCAVVWLCACDCVCGADTMGVVTCVRMCVVSAGPFVVVVC